MLMLTLASSPAYELRRFAACVIIVFTVTQRIYKLWSVQATTLVNLVLAVLVDK